MILPVDSLRIFDSVFPFTNHHETGEKLIVRTKARQVALNDLDMSHEEGKHASVNQVQSRQAMPPAPPGRGG